MNPKDNIQTLRPQVAQALPLLSCVLAGKTMITGKGQMWLQRLWDGWRGKKVG
jgi:hypothetical protein